jgi:hypothetical protein
VEEGTPVRVRVDAPAFEVLGESEKEIDIRAGEDSEPVVFYLRPEEVQPARVNFDFFQSGHLLGTASVPVEITEERTETLSTTRPGQSLQTVPADTPVPDFTLYVRFDRFNSRPAMQLELQRKGEVLRSFHPIPLDERADEWSRRRYEELTQLSAGVEPTGKKVLDHNRPLSPEEVDRRARNFGHNLWDELPEGFRAMYAENPGEWRDATLLIVSDEPYVPWELVWPSGEGWEDEAPWCITTRMTRWLRRDLQGNGHAGPPPRLPFSSMACVAPTDSGLPAAQDERALLSDIAGRHGLTDMSPPTPSWMDVDDMLKDGGYDWLHVASHGSFDEEVPNADSALWMQGVGALNPDVITGRAAGHIRRRRPGFLFNACHSGRQGWSLTGLGGWANKLIHNGAGLFVGPLWTVSDGPALTFARTFYDELLDGRGAAEAIRQARLAARREGDLTWLAYSAYAHLHARLVDSL